MAIKPSLGSVSSGTLRTEDLLHAFATELEALAPTRNKTARKLVREAWAITDYDSEDATEIVDELQDHLQGYAPDYAYFGAHPGDGADFGFWLSEHWQDQARDDGALEVSDLSEVPKGYRGHVVHINDHGNATLYYTTTRGLREVWSIV